MGKLSENCNWEIIRKVKEHIKIPVIANGGIQFFEDIKKCLQETSSDGIMSAEGIL